MPATRPGPTSAIVAAVVSAARIWHVRECLRAAVVVEVGVGDEEPLGRAGELRRRCAQVSSLPRA